MKYSSLRAFEKHLESAAPDHISSIYMLLSKEPFERKTAVDTLIVAVLGREAVPSLCLHVFDAEKHSDEIFSELETYGFFGKKRLIIVHNVDKFDKATTARFEAYFAATPCKGACLALVAPSVNRATNFYKKAEKAGIILDVAEEKLWEREKSLAGWLQTSADSMGKQIRQPACQLMVKQLGTEQAVLHQELLKLACYVGERSTIGEADIAAVCGSVSQENAWQLSEAIFRRDPAAALRIAKALLADGTALIALLRLIRSQFQTEYQVCSILTGGGSPAEVTQEFPYMKGQILERHMQQALNYGMQHFKEGLLKVDEAELQAKNSSIDPDLLVEMLIIKLSTK